MSKQATETRKWRDDAGNVYGIEKAVRNGRWVVIRTNAGGNRKAAKHLPSGNAVYAQRELDLHAEANGWMEVKG